MSGEVVCYLERDAEHVVLADMGNLDAYITCSHTVVPEDHR